MKGNMNSVDLQIHLRVQATLKEIKADSHGIVYPKKRPEPRMFALALGQNGERVAQM